MKIGLLLIATGKYLKFVEPLVESAREHFFHYEDVNIFLFTDQVHKVKDVELNVIQIEGEKWPYPTLHRYKYFNDNKEDLKDMEFLFYCDVDMKFVGQVGYETIPHSDDELTVVEHPGNFVNSRESQGMNSHCKNDKSTAFTLDRSRYYAGGFNGGTTEKFLSMAKTLSDNIETDLENGIIAEWHDESHLNCYLAGKKVKMLTPSHCYPESWDLFFTKRLLALDKKHEELRS